jgi:alpha-glucuronidase
MLSMSMAETMTAAVEEDGSKLWLRYTAIADGRSLQVARERVRQVVAAGDSATMDVIRAELKLALPRLLGRDVPLSPTVTEEGAIVVIASSDRHGPDELHRLGPEGFIIRDSTAAGRRAIVIASQGERGALYGVFHFLRLIQTGDLSDVDIAQQPALQLRLLNHWDNLDGSIERGYAGQSLWKWDDLPGKLDPRYIVYARANASIGINGVVLNNVNANARSLSSAYLAKAAALANLWRPYGIRVYLSANFAAPKTLGGVSTADPIHPHVIKWWREKADEIYRVIPDFGGFVVKANCEGQPGPQEHGRTHADGANVLADALAPHGGIVIWRAFVYDETVDPDRAKRAYIEFTKLDGKFHPNVVVQVKNGPIDFQPREPFHPLFGAMRKTPVVAELQIAQEYLGHSNHLVFLAPMWKEFLDSDTFAHGAGSTVAKEIASLVDSKVLTGIAAVANTGSDANWCGHHFGQANWYAFGRLAWDSSFTAEQIADEWLRMTFDCDDASRDLLGAMMLDSWETFVSYSMPLGLHHLISGNHYAPSPWNGKEPREDWTATYYHRADAGGIGFDRTSDGSRAVEQYFPPLREQLEDPGRCPEKLLLWFHRVAWGRRMAGGRTLWQELCFKYTDGAARAQRMEHLWQELSGKIDPQRHREVAQRLAIQSADARVWRDRCLGYFQQINGLPWP